MISHRVAAHPAVRSGHQRFESLLETARHREILPGGAVGVVTADEVLFLEGFGARRLRTGQAYTPQTQSQFASLTKIPTAIAIYQLVEEGKLRLSDFAAQHVPELAAVKPFGNEITVEQLLSQRSGLQKDVRIPAWFDHPSIQEGTLPSVAEVLSRLPDLEFLYPPGQSTKYSNLAYGILGLIVARLSGPSGAGTEEQFAHTLSERIFQPWGMSRSQIGFPGGFDLSDPSVDAATPYSGLIQANVRFSLPPITSPGFYGPAAGLFSTVEDVCRLAQRLLAILQDQARDSEVLSRKSLISIFEWQTPSRYGGVPMGYGGGTQLIQSTQGLVAGYLGGTVGSRSVLLIHPGLQAAVVGITNTWLASALLLGELGLRAYAEPLAAAHLDLDRPSAPAWYLRSVKQMEAPRPPNPEPLTLRDLPRAQPFPGLRMGRYVSMCDDLLLGWDEEAPGLFLTGRGQTATPLFFDGRDSKTGITVLRFGQGDADDEGERLEFDASGGRTVLRVGGTFVYQWGPEIDLPPTAEVEELPFNSIHPAKELGGLGGLGIRRDLLPEMTSGYD